MDTLQNTYIYTYIYIDDVSVVLSDSGNTEEPIIPDINFKIYPVPAFDQITVEYTYGSMQGFIIELYDVLGRKVLQYAFTNVGDKEELNLHYLKPGVYLYRIRSEQLEYQTGKIVLL